MACPWRFHFLIVIFLVSVVSCSHGPREPAAVFSGAGREAESAGTKIQFGDSCKKSKDHIALSEKANVVFDSPYFKRLTLAHYTGQGYVPKLVISVPVAQCENCSTIRFMYAKGSRIKPIEVLLKDEEIIQAEVNPRATDFTNASGPVKKLAEEIARYEHVECEVTAQ